MTFTISQQANIIDEVIEHLQDGTLGMAVARSWDYERKGNKITFTLKEGCSVDLETIFWFGYFTKD